MAGRRFRAAVVQTLAALGELGNASIAAAQNIRAACPAQITLTAPGRLAAMQGRIEAMISAAATVRPPLEKFYGLLNDEQKAALMSFIKDDGKGFVPSHEVRGIGLIGIRERAEILGGSVECMTPREGGTLIRLRIPRERAELHAG